MTLTMMYHGGRLHPEEPAKLERFKESLKDGQAVVAEFSTKPAEKLRSERSFKMLHALIRDLSRGLGVEYARMKDQVCCQWGVALTVEEATQSGDLPDWPGHLVQPWDDGVYWIRKSTLAYTTDEMIGLINGGHMMAMENDIEIRS